MTTIVVYRTSFVWELDIVREGLSRADLPYIVQTESFSGMTTSLDVSPAQGFGTRWLVLVPDQMQSQAEKVIASLHVSLDSEATSFPSMNPRAMRTSLWIAGIIVVALMVFMAWTYVGR